MVCCLCVDPASQAPSHGLDAVARACSPRVDPHGSDAVVFDVDGLSRVCGPPEVIAREVMALATADGLTVRVAIAGTATAAWVLAHARPGISVVIPGTEAATLAPLPLGWLASVIELDRPALPAATLPPMPEVAPSLKRGRRAGHFRAAPPPLAERPADTAPALAVPASATERHLAQKARDHFETFARWGLRTCGDLAALPRADIHARMGPSGVRLHQAARGEDVAPLVPVGEPRVFEERLVLEWPIEGLEPLSFVLARQIERLSTALERADRGAIGLTTRLTLVNKTVHERALELPAPLRDPRVLRTLILLDLESHPPEAAIDVVEVRITVTPGRIVQGSLLARAVPSDEDLSTLVARLGALMGDARVGAPVLLETHDERAVEIKKVRSFGGDHGKDQGTRGPGGDRDGRDGGGEGRVWPYAFRRLRMPLAVRVTVVHGTPVQIAASARGIPSGRIVRCAGPWRSSGAWWALDHTDWDRDGWDVELDTGDLCRLTRQRTTGTWEIDALFD